MTQTTKRQATRVRQTPKGTRGKTRPAQATRTKTASARRAVPASSAPFAILVALVVSFSLLGLTMVLSASSVTSLADTGSPWGEFISQSMWLGIGLVVCAVLTFVDHRILRKFTIPALVGSFVLLVMVLLPWFGVEVNGAQRWIRLGPLQFQPSEVAKLTLALFAADNLARSKTVELRRSLRPILCVLTVYALLIMLQPNLGTVVIIFAIGIGVLFASGIRLWAIGALTTISALGAGMIAYVTPFRRRRLLAFRDPWSDPLGDTWQTLNSLVSVANGGVTGVGIGESRGKYGYLPEAHNDFVFAVIAEEFGLVGASMVVIGFVLFGVMTLVVARRAERFGALLVIGIGAWITVQAFINIGGVLGVMPITGVPLPFMSAGGTSLVATLGAIGIMFNVARTSK